jgi:hypothetical protein
MKHSCRQFRTMYVCAPNHSLGPLQRDLLELYNACTTTQLIALYAALMRERRVVFTGGRLAQISACVLAAPALIYPMHW